MKTLRWAVVLAVAIVAGGVCVAEIREPWMTLVADGTEYDGLLTSYCWSSVTAVICADGPLREPPVHVVHSTAPVLAQVRTRAGLTELKVRTGPDWRSGDFMTIDTEHAGVLRLPAGTHYIAVNARWPRGDGLFVFGLRVDPS